MMENSRRMASADVPELAQGTVDRATYDVLTAGADEDFRLGSWLDAALWHASARAESQTLDSRLTPYVYDALVELGKHLQHIYMLQEYRARNSDADSGELSHFLARSEDVTLRKLCERLCLRALTKFGRGEAASVALRPATSDRIYRSICQQVLGVLGLCGRYDIVERHIRAALPTDSLLAGTRDPKTLLQEISAALFRKAPTYECVAESGPDHAKSFRWRVALPDGRWAEGSGRSRKGAQAAAATALLRSLPQDTLRQEHLAGATGRRRTTYFLPNADELPPAHVQVVHRLLAELKLPRDAAPTVSQALTHTSWPPEHIHGWAVARDYTPLATIGAFAIPLPFWRSIVTILLRDPTAGARRPSGSFLGVSNLSELARALNIEQGLALGRGQASAGATPAMLSEATQAVLATVLLFRGVRDFVEVPPPPFLSWIEPRARAAAGGSRGSDYKTSLQELLNSLKIEHQYGHTKVGPDHDARFRSTLAMTSTLGALRVTGEGERSKRDADRRVAQAALTVIRAVNRPWTESVRAVLQSNTFAREVAAFVLRQALALAHPSMAKPWFQYRLLASELAVRDCDALYGWATDVAAFLKLTRADAGLRQFFVALPLNAGGPIVDRFLSDLRRVAETFRATDLDGAESATEGEEYRILLDLARITRLAARPAETRDCRAIIDECALLTRGVTLVVDLPDIELPLEQRDGALQALIAETSATLITDDQGKVVVHTTEDHRRLNLKISGEQTCRRFRQRWNGATLLHYLRAHLSAQVIDTAADELLVEIPLSIDDSFPVTVVRAVGRGLLEAIPAAPLLASRFHDLKNELVACSVAAQVTASSRTEGLRLQYEVSQHLDRASELATQLLDITRVMEAVVPEPVDMLSFMGDFLAALVRGVPPGIQIVSPSASTPFEVVTSGTMLRSILDNLVRNAVQAMPGGGSLRLEWVADPAARAVVIEVSDTGGGLPPEVRRALDEGVIVHSTRRGGSGIGLWSIYQVAARLGIDVLFESSDQGTTWWLAVPSLTADDGAPSKEFDAGDAIDARM